MDPTRLGRDTQKNMARNKHMEQRLSRSDVVDGGSGRRAASMNTVTDDDNYQGRRLRGADARHRVRASVECPDLPHLHTTLLLVTRTYGPSRQGTCHSPIVSRRTLRWQHTLDFCDHRIVLLKISTIGNMFCIFVTLFFFER